MGGAAVAVALCVATVACGPKAEATPSAAEATSTAATATEEAPLPALGGILDLFPTPDPGEVARKAPAVLTEAVSPTPDEVIAAWREYLAGARIIETGGPRDLCVDGTYTGLLAGDGQVNGTWEVRRTAGRPTDVLLHMPQSARLDPVQVTLSYENGQPRFAGARLKVVESPVCR
jgi:hypothetical protein